MKQTSFLEAISQPHPHRTSVHSHMQSTAHHYNSILNAKTYLNNSTPKQQISLDILNNKRAKNIRMQRAIQNRKLLRSLIDIQRNYSLYGTKYSSQLKNHSFNTTKLKSPIIIEGKLSSIDKIKTSLKNPFVQKMKTLHISQQNLKLFDKISNIESSFANKKTMKQWNSKLDYWGSFLQSNSHLKQSTQQLKKKFFSTFVRMREQSNKSENKNNNEIKLESVRNTLRLSPNSKEVRNPELQTLGNSKRIATEMIRETSPQERFRVKKQKKKIKKSKRIQTQDSTTNPQQILLYSDHQ